MPIGDKGILDLPDTRVAPAEEHKPVEGKRRNPAKNTEGSVLHTPAKEVPGLSRVWISFQRFLQTLDGIAVPAGFVSELFHRVMHPAWDGCGGERSARMRLLFEANYRRELTKLLQGSGFHLRRKLLCLQKALVSLLGSAVSLLKSHNRKSSPSPLQRNERPPAYKGGEVRLCCFRGNPRRRANLASPPARALIPPRISTLLKNRAIPGILTLSCPFSFFFFSSRAFSKSQRRFPPFYPPEQTGKKKEKKKNHSPESHTNERCGIEL